MSATRHVGRGGFTGSPITVWCPACEDWVIEKGDACLWCLGEVEPRTVALRVEREARDERRRLAREHKAEVTCRIRAMYAEGKSQGAIGAAVGLSRRTVQRRLRS